MSLEIFVVCMLGVVNLLWTQLVFSKLKRIHVMLLEEKYKRGTTTPKEGLK